MRHPAAGGASDGGHGCRCNAVPAMPIGMFFSLFFPALSSNKALGFTTRSLHQCCRAQYSHPIYRVT